MKTKERIRKLKQEIERLERGCKEDFLATLRYLVRVGKVDAYYAMLNIIKDEEDSDEEELIQEMRDKYLESLCYESGLLNGYNRSFQETLGELIEENNK